MASSRVPRSYEPNPLASLLLERQRSGTEILDLTVTNPTSVGLSGSGERALVSLANPKGALYEPDPRGDRNAREAIAAYYAARAPGGSGIDPSHIFLTASTSEAYSHLFRLLCDPGDEILIPRPSYPLLEPIAQLDQVQLREYRLAYGGRWSLDLDSLEAGIGPRTRAVVVIEPNNPTGSTMSPQERDSVESICAERGLSVISDEVFGDFPWPDRTEVIPSWIAARRAPTFVLSGISKLCGLPQMKLGWIVGCGPEGALRELLQGLEWISDLFLSVGTPIQIALPSLLEGRALFQAATRERIGTNLRLVRREKPGVPFTLLEAEAGWSAVLRFEPRTASAGSPSVAEWALKRHDVYIHPGHFYELPREDDVVVSLLTKPATMEEAIGRIRDSWDEAQLVP